MKTLKDYLLLSEKEYKFRIRFTFEPDDVFMDRLEKALSKYDCVEISSPLKTMFQKHALGFTQPVSSEIYIIDVVLKLGTTSDLLKTYISNTFKIDYTTLSVLADGEETILFDDEDKKEQIENTEDKDKIVHSDYYGEEYNKNMLAAIEKSKK